MEEKQYTIKDIARLCGVSAGTVDRVLHGRTGVSLKSKKRVEAVLKEINYKPNIFAIGLAAKKKYRIICLLPMFSENDYWYSVDQGVIRAREELRHYNISVECIYFNYSNGSSFDEASSRLVEEKPDAAMIVPTTMEGTLGLTQRLKAVQVPYTIIDVSVEGAGELKYIGQNSVRSGYMTGKLLLENRRKDADVALFMSDYRNNSLEVQMMRRMEGFIRYVNEECDHIRIHDVRLSGLTYEDNLEKLDLFFRENSHVNLGVAFNSRVHQVGRYLEEHDMRLDGLIGYDLLPLNVEYLKKGYISLLISQRPALQGYCGVKALADYVVFKQEQEPCQYMPIDLLTKENIEYYVEI